MSKSKSLLGVQLTNSVVFKTASDGQTLYQHVLVRTRSDVLIKEYKKEVDLDDHYISLEKLAFRYYTDLKNGLTREKAMDLLRSNGANSLADSTRVSNWIILAEHMFGGYGLLLWAGGILSFSSYIINSSVDPYTPLDEIYLGSMLIATNIFTGFFGFYQETVHAAIMEGFQKLIPNYATVVRDGTTMMLPSEEVVLGDLVKIRAGDIVPGDIRVIEAKGLKVDNSTITGEAELQSRHPECTNMNPLETANLAFYGTNVMEGAGAGIVISCGEDTVIGHIAALTSELEKGETPMKKELRVFMKKISIISILQGVILFGLFMTMGYSFTESFTYFVAIIVGNVPEGLLVTLTACLTITAKRMRNNNCLVRNVHAIETLGATNVICSDKTGTLTQNKMTVAHFYYDGQTYEITDFDNDIAKTKTFKALCRIAILCNRAEFKTKEDNLPVDDRQCFGDATEIAVLKTVELLLGNTRRDRFLNPKVCEIPFNSVNKYQISIHETPLKKYLLVMKGAPEHVLELCSTILIKGQEKHLQPSMKTAIENSILDFGRMGERVIAFADLELDSIMFPHGYRFDAEEPTYPLDGLRLVGLISMLDPPRLTVPDAIGKCRTAGIKVVMVTGDHPATGIAIAKKVGIISGEAQMYESIKKSGKSLDNMSETSLGHGCVVTGSDMRNMGQDTLDKILKLFPEIVFARTSPQQKLQIVESFQRLGAIVAVTGDGVNDSPALKKADIGVAMGITGSDVTKEAADIVLLDDNFASIVLGIEEGRLVFDNLKKSIAYVLSSNIPEVIPLILFVVLNIPQSLSVMCIIAINTGTDLWPAISLAYENAEADIMMRKPRNPETDKLITGTMIFMTYGVIGLIQACASFVAFFFLMALYGFFWDRLLGCRLEWESPEVNDFKDSYGVEWTYAERMVLSRKCFAAFFFGVVTTQVSDLLICKTRTLSFFTQGMKNWALNYGLIFEISLALLIVYCPGVNTVFQMDPVEWYVFLPAVPFSILIFVFDEIRKKLLRKYPECFIKSILYY